MRFLRRAIRWLDSKINSPRGQWMKELDAREKLGQATAKIWQATETDYDAITSRLMAPAPSAARMLIDAVMEDKTVLLPGMAGEAKVEIERASLVETRIDDRNRTMPKKLLSEGEKPYRIAEVQGNEAFREAVKKSEAAQSAIKESAPINRRKKTEAIKKALESAGKAISEGKIQEDIFGDNSTSVGSGFVDTGGIIDGITTTFDRSQFTEFVPIFGNQFYKQQYFYDMLLTQQQAYEAWNHNPIAKRIVNYMAQYVIGRGVKISTKNQDAQSAWEDFENEFNLLRHMRFWIRERIIYGELMLNKLNWQTIDPSSIWEIIHVPDNVEQQVYYFQAFLSDFQMFTGYKVPGAPGSEKIPTVKFQINQIPADQVIHLRGECVSNEKRGRSVLFPVLGWLKAYKDLMFALVHQEQLQACFVWDDLVVGDDGDVLAHARNYAGMPVAGSVFAHNEKVTRTPVSVGASRTSVGGSQTAQGILAFIATSVGIPKEHLNIMGAGGSNRATALVASEPGTKVIDELQSEFEILLHEIAKIELPRRGVEYDRKEIEFVFPSITKDTATEVIANIMSGEAQGYISQRTAATLYASEMSISTYDFEGEQQTIVQDKNSGFDQLGPVPPPPSRTAGPPPAPDSGSSDIHGQGAQDVKDALNTL